MGPNPVYGFDFKQGYIFASYMGAQEIQIYHLDSVLNLESVIPVTTIENADFGGKLNSINYHVPTKQLYVTGRMGKVDWDNGVVLDSGLGMVYIYQFQESAL